MDTCSGHRSAPQPKSSGASYTLGPHERGVVAPLGSLFERAHDHARSQAYCATGCRSHESRLSGSARESTSVLPSLLRFCRTQASIGGEGEIDSGHPGPRPSGAPPGVQNRSRDFVEPLASIGGEGEIRTRDRIAPMPVFKTGAFNRSATSPYLNNQLVTVIIACFSLWVR